MEKQFETKSSKIKECRAIIARARANNYQVSWGDSMFLSELLRSHQHYESKVGDGIDYFFVAPTRWGNDCLFLKRLDGTETDFSFMKCIESPSHLQEVKKACRTAICREIQVLKHGKGIAHHKGITFDEIFKRWVAGKNVQNLDVNKTSDGSTSTYFINKEDADDFRKFHNSLAIISAVTPQEHKIIHSARREI